MRSVTPEAAKDVIIATVAIAAVFGIVSATTDLSGWLWTLVRAFNAAAFVVALLVWLVTRRAASRDADSIHER
jgi:hypothetical protein